MSGSVSRSMSGSVSGSVSDSVSCGLRGRGGRVLGGGDRLHEPALAAVLDRPSVVLGEASSGDRQRVALAPFVDLGGVAVVIALRVRAEAVRVEHEEER